MSITTLPTPPSPADTPADFASKGDALLSALPQFVAEANAMEVALTAAASGINTSTCATSMTVGTGAKSFTAQAARNFLPGQPILIVSTANAANWMFGICTAYNNSSGAMDVTVTQTNGSGTVASWTVSLSGPTTGGTNVQVFAGSGTWTKPATGSLAMVELIGPGGGGGVNGGGGGGGAYTVGLYPIASLGATESVTLGGSSTTFGTKQTAYGGGAGLNASGGGGGGGSFTAAGGAGVTSGGAGGTGASGLAGTTSAITGGTAGAGAAHGGLGGSNQSRYGGAAGGGGATGAFNGGVGGNADCGGAGGGGGGGTSTAGGNGGVSLFGGQGGGGCTQNGAGTMGTGGAVQRNPLVGAGGNASNATGGTGGVGSGGGGGGTGGAGGPGYCRVTVW